MPVNSTHPEYDMLPPAWSRALKLVHVLDPDTGLGRGRHVVQVWRGQASEHRRKKSEGVMVEERTPLRLGQPLEHIPFVFHGPNHSLPHVDKLLLGDLIAANLDHYRPNPEYKHGVHYTALPTAYVTGCWHVAAFVKTRSSGMPSPRAPGFMHRFLHAKRNRDL